MNWLLEYWQAIESGKIVVNKRIYKQYKKLVEEAEQHKLYSFDVEKGNRPIEFMEAFCKHSKGEWAGQPVRLELFQKAFIQSLFGFVDKETGLRRFREAMFFVARKNTKTTLAAMIALYMFIADGEGGAEIYSLATKYDQASLLFNEAHNMIKQSQHLSKHVRKRKNDLYFEATMSTFRPLAKTAHSLDGLNAHCAIIDELHAIQGRELYEVMKQSMSARQQPLLLSITTAGTLRGNIFDDLYEYSCNIVDGTFEDDTFLPVLYELDDREEWKKPTVWIKANPALGVVKKLDDLETKVERAKNNPVELTGLLTKDFNIRETTYNAWLTFDQLNNEETFNLIDFRGFYAIGAADLSKTRDLTCATLLMVDPRRPELRFITQMYWLPAEGFMQRVEEEKVPYDRWHERGLLRLCEGNTINYSDVTKWFLEMVNEHGITPLWIFYDAWSATYFIQELEAEGFRVIPVRQGARTLSLPMMTLGADLEAKRVIYNNHPILKWCLSNTGVVEDRNENIVPAKAQSAKMRIDGMASLLNAYVGLAEKQQEYLNSM